MKKALLALGMVFPYVMSQAQVQSGQSLPKASAVSKNLTEQNVYSPNVPFVGNVSRASLFTSDFTDTTLWEKGTQLGATGEWVFGAAPANIAGVVGVPTGAAAPYAYYNAIQYHPSQTGGAPNPTQNAWIVTADPVDLTGITSSGIRVAFKQMYRPFNTDRVFVEIANATTPGTWVSSEVNTDVATNVNAPAPIFANFDVTGMDSIYVRFRFTGEPGDAAQGGYGWAVDDVDIFELPAYDVKLTNPVLGLYTKYPLGQEERDIELAVSAKNDGGSAQALSFAVKEGATSIATATRTVNPAMTDTIAFTTPFQPTPGLGVSTLSYSATYDDLGATDTIDPLSASIEVTQSTFAKDRNRYIDGFDYAGSTVNGLPILNVLSGFRVSEAAEATSVSVMFGSNSSEGSSFQVTLYGVNQAGELEQVVQSDIVSLTAAQINMTTNTTNPKFVRVDFFNQAIPIEPGEYWVSVENQGGDVGVAYDPIQIAGEFPDAGGPSILFSTANGVDDLFRLIDGNTPAIRLNLNEPGVGIKEPNAGNVSVSVFPNPSTDVVNVTLKDFSGMTQVKMYNMNGQLVLNENVNVTSNTFVKTIDVSSFAAGVYTLTLSSEAGVSTQKVAVK